MELVNEREYQRWRWNLPESKHKHILCHFLWNHFMRNVHSCWVKCIFGSANKYLQSTILVSFQLNAFIVQKKVVKPATTCNQIPKLAKILMTFPRKEAVPSEFAASLWVAEHRIVDRGICFPIRIFYSRFFGQRQSGL